MTLNYLLHPERRQQTEQTASTVGLAISQLILQLPVVHRRCHTSASVRRQLGRSPFYTFVRFQLEEDFINSLGQGHFFFDADKAFLEQAD